MVSARNQKPLTRGRARPDFAWIARWLRLHFAFCLLPSAIAASFIARLDPESVTAGETATLQLVFTDCGKVAPPELPALANCAVQFSGSGQQYSFVNGTTSTSITHQYVLQPQAEGTVQIPALEIEVNGQKVRSNPVTLRVGKGLNLADIGFVKVVTPKPEAYLGESFPVEVKFYFRQAPQEVAPNPSLKLDGFTINKQGQRQGGQERVGAEVYGVMTWRLALTPVKTGNLALGPAEVETIYVVQSRTRRRDAFFDQFFGNTGERRRFTFASETNLLSVLATPLAGRPEGYRGVVGRYSMELSASPTNVAVGDPITVRLRVSGRGNFDALRLPEFPAGAGFQAYSGTNSFEPADELGFTGVKTFEVVLVPDRSDVKELRWPAFSAWNPEARRYDTIEPGAIPLNLRPGLQAQAQPAGNLPPAPADPVPRPPASEFRPPAPRLGRLLVPQPPVVTQPWFLALLAAPAVAYIALLALRRFQARPRDASRTLRQQRERSLNAALRMLREAAEAAEATAAPAFFQALNTALQERLALTLGGMAGSFTVEIVATRLLPLGLPEAEAVRLHRLFAALDQARYSPVVSGAELAALRTDLEAAAAALRKLEAGR